MTWGALFQKKENLCILSQKFIWLSKLAFWVWKSHSPFFLKKIGVIIKTLLPSLYGCSDCASRIVSVPWKNALSSLSSFLLWFYVWLSIPADPGDLIVLFLWEKEDNSDLPPLVLWLVDWEFYSLVRLSILDGNTDDLYFTLSFE